MELKLLFFFVKTGAMVIAPILSVLYTACFKFGVFPSNLKIAKNISDFKSGYKIQVTNFRPISLFSCFSKILEKAVYDRTINFLNDHSVQVQHNMALGLVFQQSMLFSIS